MLNGDVAHWDRALGDVLTFSILQKDEKSSYEITTTSREESH